MTCKTRTTISDIHNDLYNFKGDISGYQMLMDITWQGNFILLWNMFIFTAMKED